MRHLKDGAQWELINNKFEDFAKDPRSIRLGECTDRMNPFGDMSTKHIMMSMIIQGPKQPGKHRHLVLATGRRIADSVDRCACCKML